MVLGNAIPKTVHVQRNNDKIMTTEDFGRHLKFV